MHMESWPCDPSGLVDGLAGTVEAGSSYTPMTSKVGISLLDAH